MRCNQSTCSAARNINDVTSWMNCEKLFSFTNVTSFLWLLQSRSSSTAVVYLARFRKYLQVIMLTRHTKNKRTGTSVIMIVIIIVIKEIPVSQFL